MVTYWLGALSDAREHAVYERMRVPWFGPSQRLVSPGPERFFARAERPTTNGHLPDKAAEALVETEDHRHYGLVTLEEKLDLHKPKINASILTGLRSTNFKRHLAPDNRVRQWNPELVAQRLNVTAKPDWQLWTLSMYEGLLSAYQAFSHLEESGLVFGDMSLETCYWVSLPSARVNPSTPPRGMIYFPETGRVEASTLSRWVVAAAHALTQRDTGESRSDFDWQARLSKIAGNPDILRRYSRGDGAERGIAILGEIAVTLHFRLRGLQGFLARAVERNWRGEDLVAFHDYPLTPDFLQGLDRLIRRSREGAEPGKGPSPETIFRRLCTKELGTWIERVWLRAYRVLLEQQHGGGDVENAGALNVVLKHFGSLLPSERERAVRVMSEAVQAMNKDCWDRFAKAYLERIARLAGLGEAFPSYQAPELMRVRGANVKPAAWAKLAIGAGADGGSYFLDRGFTRHGLPGPTDLKDDIWVWMKTDPKRPEASRRGVFVDFRNLVAVLPDERRCNPWLAYS